MQPSRPRVIISSPYCSSSSQTSIFRAVLVQQDAQHQPSIFSRSVNGSALVVLVLTLKTRASKGKGSEDELLNIARELEHAFGLNIADFDSPKDAVLAWKQHFSSEGGREFLDDYLLNVNIEGLGVVSILLMFATIGEILNIVPDSHRETVGFSNNNSYGDAVVEHGKRTNHWRKTPSLSRSTVDYRQLERFVC